MDLESNLDESVKHPAEHRAPSAPIKSWLALAAHPATVRRASLTALVVGVILITINHGPALASGTVTRGRVIQICLTFLVPYLVSTTSSISTRREMDPSRR